ncbi:MAG: UDP-N-acetylglucosamine diphosphorylase/glucosamine-1-phosphate N-acetyltransferase [Gammaproteobacteria bacterium]|nr:UDP-N-acetylglucosamine diphosphorylase/glucosamine-1-phosphate N-acetyltransferase [Gammaproteobacteria bacterium]
MKLEVIVLAAGQGTRMKSSTPKVLHSIGGKPMLQRVLGKVRDLAPQRTHVVVAQNSAEVKTALHDCDVNWVVQSSQLGTGHAVLQALPQIDVASHILVLYGDCPLVTLPSLKRCVLAGQDGLGLVTAIAPDPTGLGRIVRDATGRIKKIVEHVDLTPDQQDIKEINSGILSGPAELFRRYLPQITDANVQGEIYLTDLIGKAVENEIPVATVLASDHRDVMGVNDRVQLAEAERTLQWRYAERLMRQGVSMADPRRFDCRGQIEAGKDCYFDVNVVFEGNVHLGDKVTIGPNCLLRNVQIGSHTVIKENTVIENAELGRNCAIGPFARIRPETVLADNVYIGNFVEIKKATIAAGVKAGHLAYIGDAEIGEESNIGAGAITCNFDGKTKHRTIIGDRVFVGSNSSLIAPLIIKSGAAIAAGSSINRTVAHNELVIERSKQRHIEGGGSRFRKS